MDKNFKFGLPDSVIDSVRQIMEAKKMKGVCPHCGKNPCECDHDHDKKDMKEELKGDQKKIDANHNGKIDAEDFKILRKKKGMKEEVEEIDEDHKVGDKVHAGFGAKGGAGFKGTVHKVEDGFVHINIGKSKYGDRIVKAPKRFVTKEEVEEIDELSKGTLGSYVKKSNKELVSNPSFNPKRDRKTINRTKGIERAVDKLTKEEVEFSAEELARIEEIAANLDEVVTTRKMTPAEKKAHAEYLSKHSEKLAQAEKTAVKGSPKTFKQRNTEPGDYSKEPSKMGLRQSLADKGKVS
jgi:preprotein translocase subunit YajC